MKLMSIFFVVAFMCGTVLCVPAEKAQHVKKEQVKDKRALRMAAEDDDDDQVSNLQLLVPMAIMDDGIIKKTKNPVVDDRDEDEDDNLSDNTDEGTQRVVVMNNGSEGSRPVVVIIDAEEGDQPVVFTNDRDYDRHETQKWIEGILANINLEGDVSLNVEEPERKYDEYIDKVKAWYANRYPPSTPKPAAGLVGSDTSEHASPELLTTSKAVSIGEHDANTCPDSLEESSKLDSGNQKKVGQKASQGINRLQKLGGNNGQKVQKKQVQNRVQGSDSNKILQKFRANHQSANQKDQSWRQLISGLDWSKIRQLIQQSDQHTDQPLKRKDVKQKDHRSIKKVQDQNTHSDQIDQWLNQLNHKYSHKVQPVKQKSQPSGLGHINLKVKQFWNDAKRKWQNILHGAAKNRTQTPKNKIKRLKSIGQQKQPKQKSQDSRWEKFAQAWKQAGLSSDQSDRSYQKKQSQHWSKKKRSRDQNQLLKKAHSLFRALLNQNRRSSNDVGPPPELSAPENGRPTP